MAETQIEWTDATWNAVAGCSNPFGRATSETANALAGTTFPRDNLFEGRGVAQGADGIVIDLDLHFRC